MTGGRVMPELRGDAAGMTIYGSPHTMDEEFLALVTADPDLLRTMFDDIVRGAWDQPPDTPRPPEDAVPQGSHRSPSVPGCPGADREYTSDMATERRQQTRERSPPLAADRA
jgi:hypothetical protein